ncbi:MAG TPA: hypothetical protein VGT02_18695 [Methylomirabilota bacterium]|jgi:hypothetical protein|nr:hypothetical protein [Methylomirabilota bacterium]
MKTFPFVVLALAFSTLVAGCATTQDTAPSASPILILPDTDAPSIDRADRFPDIIVAPEAP